ncbi:MAG: hypothetical protein V1743_03710 [Nanoarchaeota archaeon]
MIEIPKDYLLAEIAQHIANKWNLQLEEPRKKRSLWEEMNTFHKSSIHLTQLAYFRGRVEDQIMLMNPYGENARVHYCGARSAVTQKTIESIYAHNANKVLIVTWGYPEDTGVLEVTDLPGSLALEKLSRVRAGQGGRGSVVYSSEAPKPQPYFGVSQFYENSFDAEDGIDIFATLKETIDILLQ